MSNLLGVYGEVLAAQYLRKQGHEIITTNFRCHIGEIDIISMDKDTMVFTEVKARISRFADPAAYVDFRKQKKIMQTARVYVVSRKVTCRTFRFDVIEVYMKDERTVEKIVQHKNAFGN